MRHTLTTLLLAATTLVAAAQSPADGAWTFTLSSPMGIVEAKVEMKVDGETLTGTSDLGGGREWPIEDGTIDGNEIAFVLNRPGAMTYEMKGTITGDTIAGQAMAMGATVDWSMARAK